MVTLHTRFNYNSAALAKFLWYACYVVILKKTRSAFSGFWFVAFALYAPRRTWTSHSAGRSADVMVACHIGYWTSPGLHHVPALHFLHLLPLPLNLKTYVWTSSSTVFRHLIWNTSSSGMTLIVSLSISILYIWRGVVGIHALLKYFFKLSLALMCFSSWCPCGKPYVVYI